MAMGTHGYDHIVTGKKSDFHAGENNGEYEEIWRSWLGDCTFHGMYSENKLVATTNANMGTQ